MKINMAAGLLALGLCLTGTAQAGRSCEGQPLLTETVVKSLNLAARTAAELDAAYAKNGTRVVLLARAGQDLSKYQQTWSHVGWVYRSPAGAWRVVHKLNTCGTDQASITRQGLGEFFLDDLFRYDAKWVPAPQALQAAMWQLLQDKEKLTRLHEPHYSMLAYPWATRYQQSNQWAIETLTLAAEPDIRTREQAQAWVKFKGYEPGEITVRALARLGGRITRANLAFDDHPSELRFANRIRTITADSVLQWLPTLNAGAQP